MKLITIKNFDNSGYSGWELPKDIEATEEPRISAQFAHGTADTLRGLDPEEEKKYLPNLLGVQPDSDSWRQEVKAYWCNMSIIVPPEGLILNIGVDSKGEPENLNDYIRWRFASKHSWVASNQKAAEWPLHRFYIIDAVEVKTEQTKEFELRNRANKAYVFLQDDKHIGKAKLVAEVLRNSDEKIVHMTNEELYMFLEGKMKEDVEKFLKVINDKDLEQKAFIMQMLEKGIIEKNGNSYFYGSEIIGVEAEAIAYIKNPVNSKAILEMKEKLKGYATA